MNLFKRSKKLTHVLEEEYEGRSKDPIYSIYKIPNARSGKVRKDIFWTLDQDEARNFLMEIQNNVRDENGRKRRVIGEVWK